MKKILFSLLTLSGLLLAGCLETTQEITIQEDGSGTLTSTNDMSAMLSVLKQMGGDKQAEEADKSMDSTFSMKEIADSLPNLTEAQKDMIRKGSLRVIMNLDDEKFMTKVSLPFSTPADISTCNTVSQKLMAESLKGKGELPGAGEEGGMPETKTFDDYYKLEFSNGLLVKTLDKEKFAGAAEDPYFKSIQETAAMGLTMKTTYVINLPRPAKTVEGKGITLSEDRKKVTLSAELEDFLDEPSKLEFRIEY